MHAVAPVQTDWTQTIAPRAPLSPPAPSRTADTAPTELQQLTLPQLISEITGRRTPPTALGEPSLDYAPQQIASMSPQQRRAQLGLTDIESRRLAAALELHERILRPAAPRPTFNAPEEVYQYMRQEATQDHERFYCLALDSRCQLLGRPLQISQGDVDGTDASPRLFYRAALRAGAVRAIAVHNHPTGDPTPSTADRSLTTRLAQMGRQLDIPLDDHIILGRRDTPETSYASLRHTAPELWR
jgi:DNA repair protein RadC